MMPYTEFALRTEGSHLTHITPNIATLVGYSPDEVREMDILDLVAPSHISVVLGLVNDGAPNRIVSRTISDFVLRHKDGHHVHCQVTLACRYDGGGHLVECFGAIRRLPAHQQFAEFETWWIAAPQLVRQLLSDSLELFPVPA
jgi:PAS domain S-box-containing protein